MSEFQQLDLSLQIRYKAEVVLKEFVSSVLYSLKPGSEVGNNLLCE